MTDTATATRTRETHVDFAIDEEHQQFRDTLRSFFQKAAPLEDVAAARA